MEFAEAIDNLTSSHALLERHRNYLYPPGLHPRRTIVHQFLNMTPTEVEEIEEAIGDAIVNFMVAAAEIRSTTVSEERDEEVYEVANALRLEGLDAAREARTAFAFYAYEADSEEEEMQFTVNSSFWGRVCDRIAITCS